MAEMKKVATRDSYGNALKELGAQYDNLVVLDADLAGATKTSIFQKGTRPVVDRPAAAQIRLASAMPQSK